MPYDALVLVPLCRFLCSITPGPEGHRMTSVPFVPFAPRSFLTPKTVLYLRIVQGISPIVQALGHPTELRTQAP